MKRFAAISLMMILTGCAVGFEEAYQTNTLIERQGGALKRTATFTVAVKGDGGYGTKIKAGSGAKAQSAMVGSLQRYAKKVLAIRGSKSEAPAREEARRMGTEFLVYLMINNWEERATAWSGKPDRLEAEIRLIDLDQDSMLEAVVVKGNSKWATLGGDHVEDLLPKPFNEYVDSLFGVKKAKKE